MYRKPIITSSSILLCSILSATVWADGHGKDEAKQPLKLQDVTVTGTKEGEVNLQEVPSAITAYTEEDITDAGINNIRDLRMQTPGLNLTHNGQSARLYMRGIGSNLDFIGSDPSVTVHVDGVYQSRTTSILEDFLDVERVEVLRGPQGTLYGRNSTGGTINVITKKPEAEPSGKLFAEVGSYSYRSVGGMINGALADDSVMGRLAVVKTDHDPYVKNEADTGIDGLLDDDSLATRGALRFVLDEGSEFVLRADYSEIDRNPAAYKPTLTTVTGGTPGLAGLVNIPADPWTMNVTDVDPFTEIENKGVSAELSLALSPELSLVSLTSYRDLSLDLKEDTDGSDFAAIATELTDDQDQIAEELRLHYKGDNVSLVAGVYFLEEGQETLTEINNAISFDAESDTSAYAVFGQGTFAISSNLNATLGLRYSNEEKDFSNVHDEPEPEDPEEPTRDFVLEDSDSWDSWSPKLVLDYTSDQGAKYYGSISRGFKSGGFNFTANAPSYDPEYVWSYEIGAKYTLLDRKLTSNVALFYYDYKDLQVQDFVRVGVLSVTNAAEATVQGFEIENQWMPTYNLLLEADYAFLDARYDKYDAPAGDAKGDRLVASPRHKLGLAGQYFHDLDSGTLSYRIEYSWMDEQFFTAPNQNVSKQGAYGLVNARIGFESADETWEGQAYVENLTNEAYSTSSREFPSAAVGVTKDINPPRTFGLRLVRNF